MLRLTTKTPDWTDFYARERRRNRLRKAADIGFNVLCLIGTLALAYFAMTLCSILEPIL